MERRPCKSHSCRWSRGLCRRSSFLQNFGRSWCWFWFWRWTCGNTWWKQFLSSKSGDQVTEEDRMWMWQVWQKNPKKPKTITRSSWYIIMLCIRSKWLAHKPFPLRNLEFFGQEIGVLKATIPLPRSELPQEASRRLVSHQKIQARLKRLQLG